MITKVVDVKKNVTKKAFRVGSSCVILTLLDISMKVHDSSFFQIVIDDCKCSARRRRSLSDSKNTQIDSANN